MRKTLQQRQVDFDETYRKQRELRAGGVDELTAYFQEIFPAAGIKTALLLVTGQTELPDKNGVEQIELSLAIHLHSTGAIPNVPQGHSKQNSELTQTFAWVHPANSVHTMSYSTLITALYTGNDPPTIPP